MKLPRERFAELTERAFASLPAAFREKLGNLSIEVRAFPGREAGRRARSGLMGLHISGDELFPARVLLYQRNIEPGCASEDEVYKALRTTLLHELAHHFGFSERDIREKWPEGS